MSSAGDEGLRQRRKLSACAEHVAGCRAARWSGCRPGWGRSAARPRVSDTPVSDEEPVVGAPGSAVALDDVLVVGIAPLADPRPARPRSAASGRAPESCRSGRLRAAARAPRRDCPAAPAFRNCAGGREWRGLRWTLGFGDVVLLRQADRLAASITSGCGDAARRRRGRRRSSGRVMPLGSRPGRQREAASSDVVNRIAREHCSFALTDILVVGIEERRERTVDVAQPYGIAVDCATTIWSARMRGGRFADAARPVRRALYRPRKAIMSSWSMPSPDTPIRADQHVAAIDRHAAGEDLDAVLQPVLAGRRRRECRCSAAACRWPTRR